MGLFAGIRRGKRYVSYYLMSVYASPDLVASMSPELRRRMQGKSCFNFTSVDEPLFDELERITVSSFEPFVAMASVMAADRSAGPIGPDRYRDRSATMTQSRPASTWRSGPRRARAAKGRAHVVIAAIGLHQHLDHLRLEIGRALDVVLDVDQDPPALRQDQLDEPIGRLFGCHETSRSAPVSTSS